MQIISDKVKSIRKGHGYNQSEVAQLMEVSLRTYQRFENNPKKSSKNIKRFADVLNITPENFLETFDLKASSSIFKQYLLRKMASWEILFEHNMTTNRYYTMNNIDYKDYFRTDPRKKLIITISRQDNSQLSILKEDILYIKHFMPGEEEIEDGALFEVKINDEITIMRSKISPEDGIFILSTEDKNDTPIVCKDENEIAHYIKGRVVGCTRRF